jgi:hypothetical protein
MGASFCTNCGDGICGFEENICRCPEDCTDPVDCIGEGERVMGVTADVCCEGLTSISCAEPEGPGICAAPSECFICSYCGDGVCGAGENVCNCGDCA